MRENAFNLPPTHDLYQAWSSEQKVFVALAAMAFFAEGMSTQAMGLALPAIIKAWSIPRAALAPATAAGLLGFAGGAALGGTCADQFGRRRALICSLLLLGLATAGCGFAGGTGELSAWRVFAGLGLGASLPSSATLIAECTPIRLRSAALAVGLAFLPLGGMIEAIASAYLIPRLGWRGLFLLTGLFAGILTCAMLVCVSPPSDLGVDLVKAAAPVKHLRARLGLLMGPGLIRASLALWASSFCIVLIYYSIFSWLPTGLSAEGRAIGVVSACMSGFSIGGLFGGLLAGFSIQRLGSRPTSVVLCVAATGAASILAITAHAASAMELIVTVAILGAAVIGMQTALFTLAAFTYSSEVRATGMGMAIGWGRIGAIVSSFSGVALLDWQGAPGFFAFLAAAAMLALATVLAVRGHIAPLSWRTAAITERQSAVKS